MGWMKSNLKRNPRHRQTIKRGRKRFFDDALYLARFTIERVLAWGGKFKRLVLGDETKRNYHLGFKLIAFSLINLGEFCEG
jgi:transposase